MKGGKRENLKGLKFHSDTSRAIIVYGVERLGRRPRPCGIRGEQPVVRREYSLPHPAHPDAPRRTPSGEEDQQTKLVEYGPPHDVATSQLFRFNGSPTISGAAGILRTVAPRKTPASQTPPGPAGACARTTFHALAVDPGEPAGVQGREIPVPSHFLLLTFL